MKFSGYKVAITVVCMIIMGIDNKRKKSLCLSGEYRIMIFIGGTTQHDVATIECMFYAYGYEEYTICVGTNYKNLTDILKALFN